MTSPAMGFDQGYSTKNVVRGIVDVGFQTCAYILCRFACAHMHDQSTSLPVVTRALFTLFFEKKSLAFTWTSPDWLGLQANTSSAGVTSGRPHTRFATGSEGSTQTLMLTGRGELSPSPWFAFSFHLSCI